MPITPSLPRTIRAKKIRTRSSPKSKRDFDRLTMKKLSIALRPLIAPLAGTPARHYFDRRQGTRKLSGVRRSHHPVRRYSSRATCDRGSPSGVFIMTFLLGHSPVGDVRFRILTL